MFVILLDGDHAQSFENEKDLIDTLKEMYMEGEDVESFHIYELTDKTRRKIRIKDVEVAVEKP